MAEEPWTIGRMLRWTTGYLERHDDEHPRLSAEWLISDATGLSRVQLYMKFDQELSDAELERMHDGVLRRASGEPLQYVTGEMPFRHIVVHCERGVLIPRPETEILVDAALQGVDRAFGADREDGDCVRVLEIGTGSGCIACSIASERPGVRVMATDLAPQAVDLARRNRDALGLANTVRIVEGDLASGVDPALIGTFDVLVSNPPYIPSDILSSLPHEVIGYEPGLALDGGSDGLDVFRRILDLAPQALRPGGWLCCELYEGNVEKAADLCRNDGGWQEVRVLEDLTHRPRVLVARHAGDLATPLSEDVLDAACRAEKVVKVSQEEPDQSVVRRVADVLAAGGVAVLPTDSVYGLACAAKPGNRAHGRIFDIKHRESSQTLPLFLAEPDDLVRAGSDVPAWAQLLARRFWPGALTLVVKASDAFPADYVRPGAGTIALRVPDSELVRRVVRELGMPLAQTSANTHGNPAATSADDLDERVVRMADVIVDAGPAPLGTASTIVDATGQSPRILREGALAAKDIERAAEGIV